MFAASEITSTVMREGVVMHDKPLLDITVMPDLHKAVVDAALLLFTLAGHGYGEGSAAAASWLEELLVVYDGPTVH